MKLEQKIKHSLFWSAFLKIFTTGIKFIFTVILARILDPADFGLMAMASIIVFSADNMTAFGFSNALIQKKNISLSDVNAAFTVNLLISITFCLSCIIFSSHLAIFFNTPELGSIIATFSLIILVTTFFDIPQTLLRKDLDFKMSEIFKVLKSLSQSIISVILALSSFKVWALVYGQLFGLLIASIAIIFYTKWIPKFEIKKEHIKGLLHFGIWDFFRTQVNYFSKYGSQLIVSKCLGVISIGFFEKATSTTNLIAEQVSFNINNIMYSAFSKIQDDEHAIAKSFRKALLFRTIIGFPTCCGLALISPYFIPIVFGEKWLSIIIPMQLFCFSEIIRMIYGLISMANVALGSYPLHTTLRTINSIIMLTGCFYATRWGIIGVCFAIVAGDILILFTSYELLRNKIDEFRYKDLLVALYPAVTGCIIMSSFFFYMKQFCSNIDIISTAILVVSSAIIYTLWLLVIPNSNIAAIRSNLLRLIRKNAAKYLKP